MNEITTMYEIGAMHPERHQLVGLDANGNEVYRITFLPKERLREAVRRLKQGPPLGFYESLDQSMRERGFNVPRNPRRG